MLLTEWNTEDAKKVWYEDGLEDGREEGEARGQAKVISLLKQGHSVDEIEKILEAGNK